MRDGRMYILAKTISGVKQCAYVKRNEGRLDEIDTLALWMVPPGDIISGQIAS
jgi:hypothetical protein